MSVPPAQTRFDSLPDDLAALPRFENVETFYAADERRRFSPEWDYGVWWRSTIEHRWPRWRVSWVVETGDLYAVRLAGFEVVLLLGNVPPVGGYPYGLGSGAWAEWNRAQPVERILAGWAESSETLGWVIDQLAGARA